MDGGSRPEHRPNNPLRRRLRSLGRPRYKTCNGPSEISPCRKWGSHAVRSLRRERTKGGVSLGVSLGVLVDEYTANEQFSGVASGVGGLVSDLLSPPHPDLVRPVHDRCATLPDNPLGRRPSKIRQGTGPDIHERALEAFRGIKGRRAASRRFGLPIDDVACVHLKEGIPDVEHCEDADVLSV